MSIRLTTPWQKAALAWLMELTKKSYEGTVQCSDQAIGEALQMQVDNVCLMSIAAGSLWRPCTTKTGTLSSATLIPSGEAPAQVKGELDSQEAVHLHTVNSLFGFTRSSLLRLSGVSGAAAPTAVEPYSGYALTPTAASLSLSLHCRL